MAACLRVNDLSVTLHRGARAVRALREVSFEVRQGEIVALVGESGSGKSTLGLAIQGLLAVEARPVVTGSIDVMGQEIVDSGGMAMRAARRRIGVVFQDHMTSLNPSMSVGRQIAEAAPGAGRADAVRWLDAVGVDRPAERIAAFPHQLSGGQRQRVMLAMALAGKPALVVADEPTTALDMTVQAQILRLIAELRRRDGLAVLFVTHDLAVATALADRLLVLHAGRLVESGSAADVIGRPAHPYTQALMGSRLTLTSDRTRPLPTPGQDHRGASANAVPGDGCTYLSACPQAQPVCRALPALRPLAQAGWLAACHLAPAPPVSPGKPAAPTPAIERTIVQTPILRLAHVSKSFRRPGSWPRRAPPFRALDGIDLSIGEGQAVALVGESGSGKSTLLRIAAGLVKPDPGGRVERAGGMPQMVFQDAAASLTPWLGVGEQLAEGLRGLPRSARRAAVARALGDVGLPPGLIDAKPRQLSGGQAQRVALARAIIRPPRLLLCDEPISAIDVSLAAMVLNLIRGLRQRFGMALLFVTHDLAAARYVADRIVVLQRGRIVEDAPAADLVTMPRHRHTVELLDALPERLVIG